MTCLHARFIMSHDSCAVCMAPTCRRGRRCLHKAFTAWLAMADASVERRAAAAALLVRGTRALQAACLDAWRRGTVQRAAAQRALQAVLLKMLAAKESQVRPCVLSLALSPKRSNP